MMKVRMKVTGVDKLQKHLKALPKEARQEMAKVIKKAGRRGVTAAKAHAPVKTGETRDSVYFKYLGERSKKGTLIGVITATLEKAWPIEFGRTKGDRGTTEPHPFIRPAQQLLAKTFKGQINRAWNRAAKRVLSK